MFLHNLTIKKFHEGLLAKDFSDFEIVKEFFDYINSADKDIGAYLSLTRDSALAQAEKVDLALAQDDNLDYLAGVPLAIKDNILIEGERATAASKILENYTASYDATVIKKLKRQNAVFLGKTNMDEFAMGSSTENSAFQITHNPRDRERVPGGSSGGSAAAVAAHLAVAGLGSDTGGSIRQPASFCGLVGLKPTYGAVSRHGLMAMASSLDQIGPLAKTVEDAAILFKAIRGRDPYDATTFDLSKKESEGDFLNPNFEKIKKMKIGLPKEYFVAGLDNRVGGALEKAIQTFKGLGLDFKEINLPRAKYAISCYYIIMTAEVSANLARLDGLRYGHRENAVNLLDLYKKNRGRGFGPEARRRIILGSFVLSSGYYDAYYAKAQKARRLIKEDFDRAFDKTNGGVDVILTPTAPTPAFKIGEKISDPLSMYLSDIFTIPVNLAGLPAVSIPVKGIQGLPIGFQLIGRHFQEDDILGLGQYYERI